MSAKLLPALNGQMLFLEFSGHNADIQCFISQFIIAKMVYLFHVCVCFCGRSEPITFFEAPAQLLALVGNDVKMLNVPSA